MTVRTETTEKTYNFKTSQSNVGCGCLSMSLLWLPMGFIWACAFLVLTIFSLFLSVLGCCSSTVAISTYLAMIPKAFASVGTEPQWNDDRVKVGVLTTWLKVLHLVVGGFIGLIAFAIAFCVNVIVVVLTSFAFGVAGLCVCGCCVTWIPGFVLSGALFWQHVKLITIAACPLTFDVSAWSSDTEHTHTTTEKTYHFNDNDPERGEDGYGAANN